jgi:hypothetical protein
LYGLYLFVDALSIHNTKLKFNNTAKIPSQTPANYIEFALAMNRSGAMAIAPYKR